MSQSRDPGSESSSASETASVSEVKSSATALTSAANDHGGILRSSGKAADLEQDDYLKGSIGPADAP